MKKRGREGRGAGKGREVSVPMSVPGFLLSDDLLTPGGILKPTRVKREEEGKRKGEVGDWRMAVEFRMD